MIQRVEGEGIVVTGVVARIQDLDCPCELSADWRDRR
jgi:hypothetical protein